MMEVVVTPELERWAVDRFRALLAARLEAADDPDVARPFFASVLSDLINEADFDRAHVVALLLAGVEFGTVAVVLATHEEASVELAGERQAFLFACDMHLEEWLRR